MNIDGSPAAKHILGISAFYHDSAACLVRDGEILAAAQEERFTRKKHTPDFPVHAIQFCLQQARISIEDLDFIVFYEKPLLKFERLLETYLSFAPAGIRSFTAAMPTWLKEKLSGGSEALMFASGQSMLPSNWAGDLLAAVEERSIWNRFGL